jgi:hypothetical protein
LGIFGYYKERFDRRGNSDGEVISSYKLVGSIDRKLQKVIYQYQDHKVSISRDNKILEYGDIKIFLNHDLQTKIVIKRDKQFSIEVKERWQFDPAINAKLD